MLIFPLINDTSRKIIHIDMDAFFAAIEVRDNPALKGKPVIIAKDPRQSGGRGVVSTCSYEARAFGSIRPCLPRKPMSAVRKEFLSLETMKSTRRWAGRCGRFFIAIRIW